MNSKVRVMISNQMHVPVEGRNFLLLIGVAKYQNFPDLNNPVNDISDFRDIVLSRYRGFEKNITTIITNEEATRERIIEAFFEIKDQLRPDDDNLIIYFAGHGWYEEGLNLGYLVPYDGSFTKNLKKPCNFLSNSELFEYIEMIKSKHTLIISDACFSGTFLLRKRGGATFSVRAYNLNSRWGISAGRKELVSDGTGRNSPFAEALINFLKSKREWAIPVSELILHVQKTVSSKVKQTPFGNRISNSHDDDGGEFVFFSKNKNNGILMEVLTGTSMGQRIIVDAPHFTIGRNQKNEIVLDDSTVAAVHLRIDVKDKIVVLTNLSRKNPTTVLNDKKEMFLEPGIIDTTILENGDIISLGRSKIQIHFNSLDSIGSHDSTGTA